MNRVPVPESLNIGVDIQQFLIKMNSILRGISLGALESQCKSAVTVVIFYCQNNFCSKLSLLFCYVLLEAPLKISRQNNTKEK